MSGLHLHLLSKNKFFHENLHITHKLKLKLQQKETENVHHYAQKIQQIVEKGWCNESAPTIKLKYKELLHPNINKKTERLANERQVKHNSTVMEPSIPFHTLVKLVDAEGFTNERTRTLDLPLEINNITSISEPENLSSEIMIQILKLGLQKPLIRITNVNLNFRNTVIIVVHPTALYQTVFENNENMTKENRPFLVLNRNHT